MSDGSNRAASRREAVLSGSKVMPPSSCTASGVMIAAKIESNTTMTPSVRAPIAPSRRVSRDPAMAAMSIVTINGSTGMRIALIHSVPTGSTIAGMGVSRSRIPAMKPAMSASATLSVA